MNGPRHWAIATEIGAMGNGLIGVRKWQRDDAWYPSSGRCCRQPTTRWPVVASGTVLRPSSRAT